MKALENLLYTKTHEWVNVNGMTVKIGVTDYAQKHMGQIVFVDLPNPGASIPLEGQLAEVESVKAVSPVFSPVAGTVLEVNEALLDDPGLLNDDAYENWIVALELAAPLETGSLMDAATYDTWCQQLEEEDVH